MIKQWFMVPYNFDPNAKPHPIRWCAMDLHTETIKLAGGTWEEIEIEGNQAIVLVRAPKMIIDTLAAIFLKLDEKEMKKYRGKRLRRIPPRMDQMTKKLVFDRVPVFNDKTVEQLEERI